MVRQIGTRSIGRILSEFYGAKVKAYDYSTKKGRVYVFKVFDSKGDILKAPGPGNRDRLMDIRLSQEEYDSLIFRVGSELPSIAFKQARVFTSNRAVVNALWNASSGGREEQRLRARDNFKQALNFRYDEMTLERRDLVDAIYRELERNGKLDAFWSENYTLIDEVFMYRDEKGAVLKGETYTDSNALADMLIDRMASYVDPDFFSGLLKQSGYTPERVIQARLLDFGGGRR